MPAIAEPWVPANDVERTMLHAWNNQDSGLFLRTLAHAPLYLPGFRDADLDGRGQRLFTRQRGDRRYLLVCTSPAALYDAVGQLATGWRLTSVAELYRGWPDPEWGLVLSPTTPFGAYLLYEELAEIAELVRDEPVFHPANPAEVAMFRALLDGEPGAYLEVLVVSRVVVPLAAPARGEDIRDPGFPWLIETRDGEPTISVFTSAGLLGEAITEPVPTVVVDFLAVATAWPDVACRLAVNPGSAIPSAFAGAQVADLVEWTAALVAREMTLQSRATPSPSAPAPAPAPAAGTAPASGAGPAGVAEGPAVVVALDPAVVDGYLTGGNNTVTGLVRADGDPPAGGHFIRWRPESGESGTVGDYVTAVPLPTGAELYEVDGRGRRLVAVYQAEVARWLPSVANMLRG